MKKHFIATGILTLTLLASCSEERFNDPSQSTDDLVPISLAGQITQEAVTRVNDDGFADGDVMGVYIVDYEGTVAGQLKSQGNRGDNVRHTFDEENYRWNSAYDLYWKDKHTRIDVYGYYPFGTPSDVNNYKFTVLNNQNRTYNDGSMGDYEASDFLWGKVPGVEPTENVIRLPLNHRMANARITLVQGAGFAEGEWADLEKQVLVVNTVQDAVIDLATGTVTPDGDVSTKAIIPSRRTDEWRAIVVPQTIPAATTMFNITLGGIPYKFSKNEAFTYVGGKMSNFGIKVDKKTATGDYTLTLISESITPWENDLVSHDATLKEYVIVDVPEAGTLDACIAAAGKDLTQVRNLKITGKINSRDFAVMRFRMTLLSALNLKEVEIVACQPDGPLDGNKDWGYGSNIDDEIPSNALRGKESLVSLVLPDKLRIIGGNSGGNNGAFADCRNLSGSLIIPEGVVDIQPAAFAACTSLTGTLSLPSTLKQLGRKEGYTSYWDGPFHGCNFTCELILPEGLEEIGMGAFQDCKNLYGNLRLPEGLKLIGEGAFQGCKNLSGSLEIPQGVTTIPNGCFNECWFGGTLTLHDGITAIGESAFANCGFKGELNLPKRLEAISHTAFYNDDFSGNLVLPNGLRNIGDRAFAYNWRLMGIVEFPEGLLSIGAGAFAKCRSIEGLVFPQSLENIRYESSWQEDGGAFQDCFGIGSIVCKSEIPPYVQDGAFHGVAKDNFTLEVPEPAIVQYQAATGWREFKRISAHHELVCRPSVACAISSEHKQTLVIDAEGDWEVASIPDWCELSQTSGSKKNEVTLTIKAMASTTDSREGDVTFRLKDKDYTHKCHVSQYGYEYAEDELITLQKAAKGSRGGINIFILGDGYDASDISSGIYLKDIKEQVENFFGIEPYATYRDYFNVYTSIPLSTETGVGSINTIRYNRFNTTYTGGVGLRCDYDDLFRYVTMAPTIDSGTINETLIIVVPNSSDYGGICQMWNTGAAIAFCPKSDYGYPLDTRGMIQHEAGGHGFGKLGDEYIYHNAFIDNCACTCCGHDFEFNMSKALGWYDNLELTGKMHEVGWSHLIFDPRYSDIVDIFEGGFMHSRGVFRSEYNSCMNNDIPYYSTISRESIVRRIKRYAGETFNFEEFASLDKRSAAEASRATRDVPSGVHSGMRSMPPVIHYGNPLSSGKKSK
ncbi:MAG: fimbrillin family protein [Muribaculaceae bacterium]|nr:fimbrillin family protein [Muribaculaceae bacterium]